MLKKSTSKKFEWYYWMLIKFIEKSQVLDIKSGLFLQNNYHVYCYTFLRVGSAKYKKNAV